MRVISVKDYDEMSEVAGKIIAAQVTVKPDCVLGLATGSTPIGTYKELIKKYKKGEISFAECKTANLDEYFGISPENDQSYAYFMKDNLFSHVDIKPESTNIPNGQNPDAEEECNRYEEVIKKLGGVDLQLLGIGNNGHIGFNEPAEGFSCTTHKVALTESTIDANTRFFASKDLVPKYAYTMGTKTILGAGKILLLASGENKADAIYRMVAGPIEPGMPASILQLHKDAIVIADKKAIRLLEEKAPELITTKMN